MKLIQFKHKLIVLAEKFALGIINFQEELYNISISEINKEELIEITENITYIIGVLGLEILAINNILDTINQDEQFYFHNINDLNIFIEKIECYCSKYDLN